MYFGCLIGLLSGLKLGFPLRATAIDLSTVSFCYFFVLLNVPYMKLPLGLLFGDLGISSFRYASKMFGVPLVYTRFPVTFDLLLALAVRTLLAL